MESDKPVDARTLVCLFAKAPVAGRVKTRMLGHLSEQQCLDLHQDLIRHVCAEAARLPSAHFVVEMHVTAPHAFFDEQCRAYGFEWRLQQGADLGARMTHAVTEGLTRFSAVILLGCDCPFVGSDSIEALNAALATNPAAMIPATDGGYVALALKRSAPSLFSDMAWGTEQVAADTRQRIEQLGWRYTELATSHDIDRPADLSRLASLPALAAWAEKRS